MEAQSLREQTIDTDEGDNNDDTLYLKHLWDIHEPSSDGQ